MGVVVGTVTVSCRKESRLVLGYPLYTVITYSCDYCAFIVGKVSIRVAVWRGFGRCRRPICVQTSYMIVFTDFTQSHELAH